MTEYQKKTIARLQFLVREARRSLRKDRRNKAHQRDVAWAEHGLWRAEQEAA